MREDLLLRLLDDPELLLENDNEEEEGGVNDCEVRGGKLEVNVNCLLGMAGAVEVPTAADACSFWSSGVMSGGEGMVMEEETLLTLDDVSSVEGPAVGGDGISSLLLLSSSNTAWNVPSSDSVVLW